MGFTYFGRSRVQLYVGRIMAAMASGAVSPASQIYVIYILSALVYSKFMYTRLYK